MPGQHALLSPSSAHRWLNCPAAPRLEASAPDRATDFAREGTLAHAICARKLKEHLGMSRKAEEEEIAALRELYSPEMEEHTDLYRDLVLRKLADARRRTPDALLMVETRLDFSAYVPEAFGTADAVVIADDLLEVIDFKYGKGVLVEARDNPQMMIYALGALEAFGFEYDIRRVRMTIVQPRLDNVSESDTDAAGLLAWARDTLKPRALEAYEGRGRQTPGEWCRFCRVKETCKALAAMCLNTAETRPDPALVSKEDMESLILPRLPAIKTWLSAVEDYALGQALGGTRYKGFKLVEGRSIRRISDPLKAEEVLKGAGYLPEDYLKPQELKTITELEKAIGKKKFAVLLGDCVEKPQGKPALVPLSDKRPEMNNAADDFDGIEINH